LEREIDGVRRSLAMAAEEPRVAPPESVVRPLLDFTRIYAEHAAFVWRSLRRLGVREADVPDVCQEVFIVVHRRLHDFDGTSALRTWLFGITMRAAAGYRRSARVRREAVGEPVPDAAVAPAQADEIERTRALQLLDTLLDQLDEDKRAVFVLYELEQVSMAEVAQLVGCPLQTAYSRLHAARKHIDAAARRLQLRAGAV
jgi:RNA polymerase sigma-70 factor (ECF subfamily)